MDNGVFIILFVTLKNVVKFNLVCGNNICKFLELG